MGPNGLNPRNWLLLPKAFRSRLARILTKFEEQPEVVKELVAAVVFLQKPEGGVRLIVLLEALFKLWGKIR